MDITRRTFPARTVIGREGSTEEGEGFVQRLWTEANAHFEEIRSMTVQPLVFYGAMSGFSRTFAPWTDGFSRGLYLAGAQVLPDSAAPDGWTRWELPAMECLCTPQHPDAIAQMMAHLKAEGLTLAAAIQERTEMADGAELLCFPIRLL